jgi:hypothetical protein
VAKRKPWAQLSPTYKARLEKAGISKTDFEAGASIKAARGHAYTPERPTQYDPTKFVSYNLKRQSLITQLENRKQQVFGNSMRWSAERSQKWIREKPPSIAQIKWALNASDEEIYNAIREDPKTFLFLAYG